MSFNKNVRAAILRVSDVSASASAIAQRLGFKAGDSVTASDVTDVEVLKAKVAALTAELSELRLYVSSTEDDDNDQQSDADRQSFIDALTESLGTQPFVVISQVYDEDYFENLSRKARYAVATVLVNWCNTRKFKTMELWYNIMVNNGSM